MRPHAGVAGRLPPALAVGGGVVLAMLALLWGGAQGAYAISPLQILVVLRDALGGHAAQGPEHLVFLNIRLPRLLLGTLRRTPRLAKAPLACVTLSWRMGRCAARGRRVVIGFKHPRWRDARRADAPARWRCCESKGDCCWRLHCKIAAGAAL
jgi:hypothetical protein